MHKLSFLLCECEVEDGIDGNVIEIVLNDQQADEIVEYLLNSRVKQEMDRKNKQFAISEGKYSPSMSNPAVN